MITQPLCRVAGTVSDPAAVVTVTKAFWTDGETFLVD
jgi:hypothetical protein